jgi:hypothetical protein
VLEVKDGTFKEYPVIEAEVKVGGSWKTIDITGV